MTATLHGIPYSHAGIEATVRRMRSLVRRSQSDPRVQDAARRVVAGRTGAQAAGRIRRFLSRHVRFTLDPYGVELLRTPWYMLDKIQRTGTVAGDCDDVAVLGAALGMAAGLRPRYVLVGLTPTEPFEHVYTELLTTGGPVELDTTRPAQMPQGVRVHRIAYREA